MQTRFYISKFIFENLSNIYQQIIVKLFYNANLKTLTVRLNICLIDNKFYLFYI